MDKTIPIFLEYGSTGILALGFIVLLILFVRSDKRAAKYAAVLGEATFDRSQLITVLIANTQASMALKDELRQVARSQDKACTVIDRLDRRLEADNARENGRREGG